MVLTPLDFVGDAICLSGLTGTKLKCDVIGIYYWFWWGITSGGPRREHGYPTAIVELNAATGEDYIEETHETVLGSAGHALQLKVEKVPHTENLKVVLIEEHSGCYAHLKNVIIRRWPSISIVEAEGPIAENSSNIYLLNKTLDEALEVIEELDLGNALYFFDPLRSVEYTAIENVAGTRMDTFYKKGTEFIIFIFTSDWFRGRDDFAPLPCTAEESTWTKEESETILEADSLFGNTEWRSHILNSDPIEDRGRVLIELYKNRLHKWFRYVLPMPFKPKENQVFHLILCSNFETGVRATRDFYCSKARNPRYSPDNRSAYRRFRGLHPEIFIGLTGNKRPLQWRILWKTIREHEEGICDIMCADLIDIVPSQFHRRIFLDWLEQKGYLDRIDVENAWDSSIRQYKLNWAVLKERLGVDKPPALTPLCPRDV